MAAELPRFRGTIDPEAVVPVILLATREEARGAQMRVGGLRVIDRTLRQLARLRDVQVTIVTDGSIAATEAAARRPSRSASPRTRARSSPS